MSTNEHKDAFSHVVRGLYRVILGSDPDQHGFDAHLNYLLHNYQNNGFDDLLHRFITSNDISKSVLENYEKNELHKLSEGIKIKYKGNVFSLGTHCYTSYLLKKAGIKTFSGPFDWLFSNCELIEDCFSDDFNEFLNRNSYSSVPIEQRMQPHVNKCHHNTYRDKYGINFIFNHKDPTTDSDYEYYVRCVERLKFAINSGEKTALLCTFRDSSSNHLNFITMAKQILRYSSNAVIVGGSIEQESSAGPMVTRLFESENISLFKYKSLSQWLDVRFSSPADDIYLFSEFSRILTNA